MRSGWLGGIAACLVAVAAWGAEVSVTLNGRPVSLLPPARAEGQSILVPLCEFAPLLGVEPAFHDGRWSLRWCGGSAPLDSTGAHLIAGSVYVSLEDLVARVGGRMSRSSGRAEVWVETAGLIGLEAREGELVLRFDRFAPMFVTREGGSDVVRFIGCALAVEEADVTFGSESVARARVTTVDDSTCEVRVTFLEEAALGVRRLEADGAYSVHLYPTEAASHAFTTELGRGLAYFEGDVPTPAGPARVAYISLADWRGRADVRPLLPPGGAGTSSGIWDMLGASGAVAGLTSRSGTDGGLVVIDRIPFLLGEPGTAALGIDILGSLRPLAPEPAVYASFGASRVPLDGVDRPIGYDELVGYPAGYAGSIARGFPGTFRVIRLREGVVASIVEATYVVADPSASLLVASGLARGRLEGLSIGDVASIGCDVDPGERSIASALSIDGTLWWDGEPLSGAWSAAPAWSIAGTDWQGGLFLMRVVCDAEIAVADLQAILALLPTLARDVLILERGGAAALGLAVGTYSALWGDTRPSSVALGVFLE